MSITLLNTVVAVMAIIILLAVWGGVHLLAQRRLGNRQIGCRGPSLDDDGNEICCHTGEPCQESCQDHPPAQS